MEWNMNNKSRKLLIPIVLSSVIWMTALSACGPREDGAGPAANTGTQPTEQTNTPTTKPTDTQPNNEEPANDEQDVMTAFEKTAGEAGEAADIVAFIDKHIEHATKEQADAMIRGLHKFYAKDLEKTQNQFYETNAQDVLTKLNWPITRDNLADIKDEAVRKLVETKLDGKYKLETVEGSIFPIVDYEPEKTYASRLSPELSDYIMLQAVESNDKMAADAGLLISWDQLAQRSLAAESYATNYPKSPELEEVKYLYIDRYLTAYLYGLDNTPVYDFETFKLLNEVKISYKKLVKEHPETITAKVVVDYLDLLSKHKDQVFLRKNGEQIDITDVKTYRDGLKTQIEMRLQNVIEHQ
jgi:hypothetical protein